MKIGIVTFHRAWNYGAKLQAYALQKRLCDKYDAAILDYRCERIERQYYSRSTGILAPLKTCAKWVLRYPVMRVHHSRAVKYKKFDREYLSTNGKVYTADTIETANTDFEAFVAGSDQIWNTDITGRDMNYYLAFAPSHKRFSYAASFGGKQFDSQERREVASYLESFHSILIRERTGKEFVESLEITPRIDVVSDPVFLLSREEWIADFGLTEQRKEKYILVYLVARGRNLLPLAEAEAKELGCKLYYINWDETAPCPSGMKNVGGVGPAEFLQYIYNAELVLTTSFHAMAFSLIFNKPFYYELSAAKRNNNARLYDLAEIFNVSDREILSDDPRNDAFDVEWEKINADLQQYAVHSMQILFDSLNNAEGGSESRS